MTLLLTCQKRDDVRNGKVYNTRKFTITFTANGINETSELIVKEMPLLLLTDEPDPNKRGAVYARRLDGMYLELGTLDGDYAPQGRKQYINRTNTLRKADRLCAASPDGSKNPSQSILEDFLLIYLQVQN